jgi:chemotaxis protein MotB
LDYDRLVKREKEESMVTQLKQALDKKDLSKYAKIETWDKKIRLILASAVLFDSGRATLAPRSEKILAAVAEQIKTLDNPIQIEGHTDNVPIHGGRYKSNWELSMARAYSVLVFLKNHGIAPQRLSAIGYGKYHPIADNNTAEGRAKNRRIEIDLLRTE